jgi:hypothetical protein
MSSSLSGDVYVVGAPDSDVAPRAKSGSAFVFRRNAEGDWIREAELVAPDRETFDSFGYEVAYDGGDTLAVGAPGDDDEGEGSGSVYLFVNYGSQWFLSQKLSPPNGAPKDFFGGGLAIRGDRLFVGAHGDDDAGYRAGAVYIYERAGGTWSLSTKLTPTATIAPEDDEFGSAISTSGNFLFIAAGKEDGTGALRIYEDVGGTWTFRQVLTPLPVDSDGWFGNTHDSDGDTLVVGSRAPSDYVQPIFEASTASGNLWVYTLSGGTWSLQQMLPTPTIEPGVYPDVKVLGDLIVQGRPGVQAGLFSTSGAVTVFERDSGVWTEASYSPLATADSSNQLGRSIELDQDLILVGVTGDPTFGLGTGGRPGAVNVFERAGATWSNVATIGKDNAAEFGKYGLAVAGDGNTIAVSDVNIFPSETTIRHFGTVRIFNKVSSGWELVQSIRNPEDDPTSDFGVSIATEGDLLAVVENRYEAMNLESEAVIFIYRRIAGVWEYDAKIIPSVPIDYISLSAGTPTVAVSGDTVVLASPRSGLGVVQVFRDAGDGTWTQTGVLTSSDIQPVDFFGNDVAISGDTIVVGSHQDDSPATEAGGVYVFTWNGATWTQTQKLVAPDAAVNRRLGNSVALDGDHIIAGAPGTGGGAYFFERISGVWTFIQKLSPPIPAEISSFGDTVALRGESAVISGIGPLSGTDADSIYFYRLSGGAWNLYGRFSSPADTRVGPFPLCPIGDSFVAGFPASDAYATDSGEARVFQFDGQAHASDTWSLLE